MTVGGAAMGVVLPAPAPERPKWDEDPELPEPWRWTRDEYHRALELGFFTEDDNVELIDGEIYPVSPQSHRHYSTLRRVARALLNVFGTNYSVLEQGPAAMTSRS